MRIVVFFPSDLQLRLYPPNHDVTCQQRRQRGTCVGYADHRQRRSGNEEHRQYQADLQQHVDHLHRIVEVEPVTSEQHRSEAVGPCCHKHGYHDAHEQYLDIRPVLTAGVEENRRQHPHQQRDRQYHQYHAQKAEQRRVVRSAVTAFVPALRTDRHISAYRGRKRIGDERDIAGH